LRAVVGAGVDVRALGVGSGNIGSGSVLQRALGSGSGNSALAVTLVPFFWQTYVPMLRWHRPGYFTLEVGPSSSVQRRRG